MEALHDGDPDKVGPYVLTARLGGGGMGRVFLGRTPGGRPVAVKMIRSDLARDPEFRRRFAHEVRAARQVGGFYTAQVVDADPDATPPWMATAYVDGPSLAQAIEGHGPLREDGLRLLGAGLAEGLTAIHRCGLVHRDLKPGNVIVADDGPRLIDFGIARTLDATTSATVIGTPGFMSPEQVRGQRVGPASDVFCLGALLAYAATGSGPFGHGRPDVVLYRIVHEQPRLTGLDDLSPELTALISACLAKEHAARPSLAAVLDRLAAPGIPLGTPHHGLALSDHGLVPADPRIRADRRLVLAYLHGRMTYEEQPWMFDEDVLMFAVDRLKRSDRRWIFAQTAAPVWPQDLKASLVTLLGDHPATVQTGHHYTPPSRSGRGAEATTLRAGVPPQAASRQRGLVLRFAAGSHKGLIREANEDSGYAGPRLLAVADGMGGAAAGEVASSEVLGSIIRLDEDVPGGDLLTLLDDAVQGADDRLRQMVEADPQLEGMRCTLTAMLWTGQRMGLVHVGDSRAYLLRDGVLSRITQDHTWVQRLVDEGRITAAEAETHPQRLLLLRALDGRGRVEPDLSIREVRAGDRYLICSDGLSGPVSHQTLQDTLGSYYSPEHTVQELIELALRGGGPDNITCIVADVIDVGATDTMSRQLNDVPVVVGAVFDHPPRL